MGFSYFSRMTDGASEGLAGYVDGTVLGTVTGSFYNFGTWICIDDAATAGGNVFTPFDGGIYSGAAQAAATMYYGGQYQAQLFGAPAALHVWRMNSTQTINSMILAANPGSVGFTAGAETATYTGSIPFVTTGGAVHWIRLYDGAS